MSGLPVLGIEPLVCAPLSELGQRLVTELRDSCRHAGFVQIVVHSVEASLKARLVDAAERPRTPVEERERNALVHVDLKGDTLHTVLGGNHPAVRQRPDVAARHCADFVGA